MLWLTRTHSERAHTNFDTSFTGAALFPVNSSGGEGKTHDDDDDDDGDDGE